MSLTFDKSRDPIEELRGRERNNEEKDTELEAKTLLKK